MTSALARAFPFPPLSSALPQFIQEFHSSSRQSLGSPRSPVQSGLVAPPLVYSDFPACSRLCAFTPSFTLFLKKTCDTVHSRVQCFELACTHQGNGCNIVSTDAPSHATCIQAAISTAHSVASPQACMPRPQLSVRHDTLTRELITLHYLPNVVMPSLRRFSNTCWLLPRITNYARLESSWCCTTLPCFVFLPVPPHRPTLAARGQSGRTSLQHPACVRI